MSRLTTLKPRVATLQPTIRTARSGDERIRGSALQKIRERILARDCGLCQCARCKTTKTMRFASLVDHVAPLWAGGRESDDNRQAINSDCHDLKSAHEARCRAAGQWLPWDGAVEAESVRSADR